MKSTSTRRLVLHFNIDKTIVCRDPYNGLDNIPVTLADCIARMAWGHVTVEEDIRKWTLAYEQFSPDQPEEDLMSYYNFLQLEYTHRTELNEEETPEQLVEANKQIDEQKREKLLTFAKPGNPGSKFKSQVDKINRATYLPKNVRENLGLNDIPTDKKSKAPAKAEGEGEGDDNGEGEGEEEEEEQEPEEETDEQKMINLFEDQKYHLLPSFFKTLIYLKRNKREFSMIIRGEDEFIKPAIFEYNKFCTGDHPCFTGKANIIDEKCLANYYRFPGDSYGMLFGTLDQEKAEDVNKATDLEEVFYDEIDSGTRTVATDGVECYVELMELFKKYTSAAIREDRDEKRVLYVDPADYNTLHIFFDAKCGLGSDCRISVRDIITNKEIPFRNAINKYIALVEPHRAVTEPDYFMKLIEMCEYTFDQEIEARESGKLEGSVFEATTQQDVIPEQTEGEEADSHHEPQELPQTEWDKLQNAPHDQYLAQTIMPVLYQGMKQVATERPECPIKALALFMLKNQDKVKLPSKKL
jgi:hypothetical protein